MALILGVTVNEVIYVGNSTLQVIATGEKNTTISIVFDGRVYNLDTTKFIELAPEVLACVGKARYSQVIEGVDKLTVVDTLARLVIDAPRAIKVKRKRTYKPHQVYDSYNQASA